MSLRRFSMRSMAIRPARTILTVLSIVIGVAAVVAVNVTTATTRTAYKQMFGFVTGKASLEVTTEGDGLFTEKVVEKVAAVKGVKAAAPVLQRPSFVYAGDRESGKRAQVQVVGVDARLDSAIREFTVKNGKGLEDSEADEVVLDEIFAKTLNLKVGDQLKIRMARVLPDVFHVAGFIEPRGASSLRQAGIVLMPLKAAQKGFSIKEQINKIQVVLEKEDDLGKMKAAIAKVLPVGLTVREPVTSSQSMEETLNGSEKGLQLATMFTLVLGVFIILNTFLMNISERRRQLAILRAIGATRSQIKWSIVGEGLILGAIGTVVGIGAGLGAAWVLNIVLAVVLDIPLPAMQLTPLPFALALVAGIIISTIGAWWPARRAQTVSPLEGMDRVSRADMGKTPLALPIAGILIIIVCTTYLLISIAGMVSDTITLKATVFNYPLSVDVDFSIMSGAGMLVGIVMAYPLVLGVLAQWMTLLLRRVAGVEAHLARLQIVRHMTRSSLTAGVLFVAGSTGLALAYSIIDNVANVNDWAKNAIMGDFFIRAMMPDSSSGEAADLPEALGEELNKLEGIDTLEAASFVKGRAGKMNFLVIGRDFPDSRRLALDIVEGDTNELRRQLKEGQMVVGSVLAQRNKLHVGDILELETTQGPKNVRICAITNDYLGGGVSVYMTRKAGMELLGMKGVDVYIIHSKPGRESELAAALEPMCDKYELMLHTFAGIRKEINAKIMGIDGFLWGMLVFEFIVAAFGVVNTLTMNVLEQTREIGLLRIVAMTKVQVRRTIMTQALIIAGAGLVPGVGFGVLLAYVMNVATKEALGHEIAFGFHPLLILGTLAVALLIVGIAAWFPARRAANLDLVSALHYE